MNPSTVIPQLEPATLIPLRTSVSHGVRSFARRLSTHMSTRSPIRSAGVCCENKMNAARKRNARASHAAVLMEILRGSGGGEPVGRRCLRRCVPERMPPRARPN